MNTDPEKINKGMEKFYLLFTKEPLYKNEEYVYKKNGLEVNFKDPETQNMFIYIRFVPTDNKYYINVNKTLNIQLDGNLNIRGVIHAIVTDLSKPEFKFELNKLVKIFEAYSENPKIILCTLSMSQRGGLSNLYKFKGRTYKVHTGPRGGKYIKVKSENIYLSNLK